MRLVIPKFCNSLAGEQMGLFVFLSQKFDVALAAVTGGLQCTGPEPTI
jgi:hypothetical protein